MIKQAQAEATAVRNEATTQVQQAQGTAVSVTQAALAIVGAIIGSSLVTILTFTLILRYRRIKRRQSRLAASSRNNISYPALSKTSNAGYGPSMYESNFNNNGFPVDVKEPPRAAGVGGPMGLQRSNTTSSDGSVPTAPRVGYASSDYGSVPEANPNQDREFKLNEAPKGKFTLFPRPQDDPQPTASTMNSTSPKPRGSKIFPPSLDTWLRAGTVSPFGTLQKSQNNTNKSDWPMKKGT
ncbi:hypothetical protein GQ53DRAFT_741885 [Thozetella sp. PMI_491]|nr:hypothetical protein GQ53DRAFT_741885 [Thozetella sp. PMI_491]